MIENEPKAKPEDFTEAEHAAVDSMAAPIIKQHRESMRFTGSQNRSAYKRMNRPERIAKIDKGAEVIHAFLERFTVDTVGPKVD